MLFLIRALQQNEGIEQLKSAIEQAIELGELGFAPATAERVAQELDALDTDRDYAGVVQLAHVYAEYADLTCAVEEWIREKETIKSDIDDLQAARSALESDRDQLEQSRGELSDRCGWEETYVQEA